MIGAIFQEIGTAVTQFISIIASGFTSMMPVFYAEEGGFTLLGTLLLVSAGVALVYWLFYFIRSLCRVNVK